MRNEIHEHLKVFLKDHPGSRALWSDAHHFYMIDWHRRKYHSISHAEDVSMNILTINPEATFDLLLAARWHDAIYFAGAGEDANERCSAAALNGAFQRLGDSTTEFNDLLPFVESAKSLIIQTSISHHLMSENLKLENDQVRKLACLLDADLGSLALPFEIFVNKQKHIVEENFGQFERDKSKSAAFLSQFLSVRPTIYHTEEAIGKWESAARNNIEKYIAHCG